MKLEIKNITNSINKAYLCLPTFADEIGKFKENYHLLIESINANDTEETLKNYINNFLRDTYYKGKFQINENINNIDLVILNGKNNDDSIGVLVETKAIKSKEMISASELNKKAFHELVLYYLEERVGNENVEIKHLIITNSIDWFIFNATEFERLFYQNKSFLKKFNDWSNQQLVSKNKDWFYSEIAKPFIDSEQVNITCTNFQLSANALESENLLIELYKVFSPEHLLKLPFQNDSNTLNREFYNELLHIVGLYETKDNTRKIERLPEKDRNDGSWLENVISIIETDDILQNIEHVERFGEMPEQQKFGIGLELCITWLNRILFLKLLESQLLKYNPQSTEVTFLNNNKVSDFEELKELFFEVLAVKPLERKKNLQKKYANVPYLNSSLFELTSLEKEAVKINHLKQHSTLPIYNSTVLKDEQGKRKTGELTVLQYIFEFLNSFNFASDYKLEIQEKNKTIINSSVLGLIFEKINGYKEGSFFTPGYITMYICRNTIRKTVVEKFRNSNLTGFENIHSFANLYNKIGSIPIEKANEIFNTLKICDPAVGSGHFLVSALNELIAIKSELGILMDSEGQILRNTYCEVQNDELFITHFGQIFNYNFKDKESQRIQETIFNEKRTLIENCLFGVDINPKSVHICRLRLWIELLKNAYYTKESDYTNLETLPNIDINIKHGNSLISRFSLNGNVKTTLSPEKLHKATLKYKNLVASYKNAGDKNTKQFFEKQINELKDSYSDFANPIDKDYIELQKKQDEINSTKIVFTQDEKNQWDLKIQKRINEVVELRKKYDEKLKTVYGNTFEWRFEFPEILSDNGLFIGFDAVVGNPPYLNFKMYSHDERNVFKTNYLEIFDGKADIYYYFFYQGLRILKPNGILCYITSRYWLEAEFAQKLRKFISNNNQINEIIDFKNATIFEGVGIKTSIAQISKQTPTEDSFLNYQYIDSKKIKTVSIPDFVSVPVKHSGMKNKPKWTLSVENELSILKKIETNTVKLEEIAECRQGIITGYDKAFIVPSTSTMKLPEKILKPWLKVGDVFKYYFDIRENQYLIYSNEIENVNDYPEFLHYISPFKNRLENRIEVKRGNYKWYELHRTRDSKLFDSPKLICRFKASCNTFALDYNKYYSSADTTIVVVHKDKQTEFDIKYLLAVLNSTLLNFYFKSYGKLMDYRYEYYPGPVGQLRIKKTEHQNEIIKIVDKIIEIKKHNPQQDTTKFEKEIDKWIYKIYNIDNDEIQIIEKNN